MDINLFLKRLPLLFLFLIPMALQAQEDEAYYESLLKEEVEVLNPVYKPVIGIGTGYTNFFGEIMNKRQNPLSGMPAYKINIATFVDDKHYLRANFFLLLGNLGGETRSAVDTFRNLNFKTGITTFGINLHYDFKPFIKKGSLITPFVSIGLENVQFNSKTDLYYTRSGEQFRYKYAQDGTIHDNLGKIMQKDYNYETDLRDLNLYGLGSYNQSTLAIPIDAGFDFAISDRVTMRMGYSFNYTFTDNIDNISKKATIGVKGNNLNDMFGYSYLSFHLDLFSSPKTITMQKLFADVDFDYSFYGDNDNDLVFDGWDQCPNTPSGVEVDSTGCPFDEDKDGVPNYLDKELNTPPHLMVDNDGVQINANTLAEDLSKQPAISRSEVESFLMMQRARTRYNIGKSAIPIPQKYKRLDKDMDGYISYDELMDAIDAFFDDTSELKTPQDIYELNDFFFAQ
jgi:hypothetical protein